MRSIVKTVKTAIYNIVKSKISITIITPAVAGVNHSTEPVVLEKDSPIVKRSERSNYRFIEETKYSVDGTKVQIFLTEEYRNGDWYAVLDSISTNKDTAIKYHLILIEHGTLKPTVEKTILWEGLGKEETKSWAILHSS